jgi:hypothetical protein
MIRICGKEIRITGSLIRVAALDADTYDYFQDPQLAIHELRESKARVDLFTFMQRPPETKPKFQFFTVQDNLAVLSVSTFDHWWTKQVDTKTRNMVRKPEKKGVAIREVPFDDALVQGIWEVYNESPVRQGKPFAHFGKDVATVHREAGTFLEQSIFIGAFFEDRLIGFVKLLCDETRTQAGLLHIVSMMSHRDKAPTNGLLAHAVRACADRGIPYLVYSRFSEGNKERDSLMDFKENNGFKRVDLPRYFVPLTPWGKVALHLGLHKRWTDHVPEAVVSRLRQLRNARHNRKLQSMSEAV